MLAEMQTVSNCDFRGVEPTAGMAGVRTALFARLQKLKYV